MITTLIEKPGWKVLTVIAMVALIVNTIANKLLNQFYAASQFPVPYFEAQLSISSEKIKGWYSFLVENNTMDKYLFTQHFDFFFIVSVFVLHLSVLLLLSRLFAKASKMRKVMIVAALISIIAPLADALENLVSYVMIANHEGFADGLAIVYSSLAAIKFAAFTFAYLAAILAVIIFIVQKVISTLKQKCSLTGSA